MSQSTIQRDCLYCGKSFLVLRSNAGPGKGRCCSIRCGALHRETTPPVVRFMAKVEKHDDGCWIWTAATAKVLLPYGRFLVRKGLTVQAHRWSYEHFVGPIPPGLTIDHLCMNPRCVNPEHLEPVTLQENLRRGKAARRVHAD